ncbi:hypothetical protein BHE74_00015607 [Ensete ventricosum]|nr:hypothetical protein BHE74_00015607 [Ensete ventricosum]
MSSLQKKITEALVQPVESLFDSAAQDIWASIRKLYRHETENAISRYSSSLTGFELDQSTFDKMMADLKNYARGVVVRKIREEAGKVLIHMKDRYPSVLQFLLQFSTVFSHDKYSMPRVWTGKEDVRKITEEARALSGLLAISTRFLPSVLNILRRVAGEGNRHHQAAQSSQQSLPSPAHTPRNQMQRRFSSSSFSSSNTEILRHSDAGPSSESVAESKSSPICH